MSDKNIPSQHAAQKSDWFVHLPDSWQLSHFILFTETIFLAAKKGVCSISRDGSDRFETAWWLLHHQVVEIAIACELGDFLFGSTLLYSPCAIVHDNLFNSFGFDTSKIIVLKKISGYTE